MKTVLITIAAVVGLILIIPITICLMYMSYNNTEVSLRNQATAQQKNLENVYDRTWKIISQQAQIADQYKDAFAKIYPDLMAGRYGGEKGGALMKFITESNPNFDTSLYNKVANSVEVQRTEFSHEQTQLLDIQREHNDIRTKVPSSFFVGSRSALEVKLVTSAKTDSAFATGKDDDVELFKKAAAPAATTK